MFANWFFCVLHILIFFSSSLYAPPKKHVSSPSQKPVVASRQTPQQLDINQIFNQIQDSVFDCIQKSNRSGLETALEMLKKFLQKDSIGDLINKMRTKSGESCLELAFKKNDVLTAKILIKYGASLDVPVFYGKNAFRPFACHVARQEKRLDFLHELCDCAQFPETFSIVDFIDIPCSVDVLEKMIKATKSFSPDNIYKNFGLFLLTDCPNLSTEQQHVKAYACVPDDMKKDFFSSLLLYVMKSSHHASICLLDLLKYEVHKHEKLTNIDVFACDNFASQGKEWSSELIEALIGRLEHIDQRDKNNRTPLMLAVDSGHLALAKALLAKGASLTATDDNGNTALLLAAARGSAHSYECLMHILDPVNGYNFDINHKNKSGNTALILASGHCYGNKVEEFYSRIFSYNPDVAARGSYNRTALVYHCAVEPNYAVIKQFIDHGVDVNAKDTLMGYVPLHIAVRCAGVDVVSLLLENGADVSMCTDDGNTILHEAARDGNCEVVKYLLHNTKLDWNIKNKQKKTAADLARNSKKLEVVRLFDDIEFFSEKIKQFNSVPKKQHKKKAKHVGQLNSKPTHVLWTVDDKYLYITVGVWWMNPLMRMLMQRRDVGKLNQQDENRSAHLHKFPFEVDAQMVNLGHVVTSDDGKTISVYIWGSRTDIKTGSTETGFFTFAKDVTSNVWFHRYFKPCASKTELGVIVSEWKNVPAKTINSESTVEKITSITLIKAQNVESNSLDGSIVITTKDETIRLYNTKV